MSFHLLVQGAKFFRYGLCFLSSIILHVSVFLSFILVSGRMLNSMKLEPKNPDCFVCSSSFVSLEVSSSMTLGDFFSEVLSAQFGMNKPR